MINPLEYFNKSQENPSMLTEADKLFIDSFNKLSPNAQQSLLQSESEEGEKARGYLENIKKRTQLFEMTQQGLAEPYTEEELTSGTQKKIADTVESIGKGYGAVAEFMREKTPDPLKPINYLQTIADVSEKGFLGLAKFIDPSEERKQYQELGIDPMQGGSAKERFDLGFARRNPTPKDIETVLENNRGKKPYFVGNLIPDDPNSPIVFQMEEGDVPKAINSPGLTIEDLAQFGITDALPITADIAASIALTNKFLKPKAFGATLPATKADQAKGFAAQVGATGGINSVYEYMRLVLGKEYKGLSKDSSYYDLAKDAGLIGVLSSGGATAIGGFAAGMQGLFKYLKNGKVPNEVLNDIKLIVDEAKYRMQQGEVPTIASREGLEFKPTFGQKLQSPELIRLEQIFLGNNPNSKIRTSYLQNLEANDKGIIDYTFRLLEDPAMADVPYEEVVRVLGKELLDASDSKIAQLQGLAKEKFEEIRNAAGSALAKTPGTGGASARAGYEILEVEKLPAGERQLSDTQNYLYNTMRDFRQVANETYEFVNKEVSDIVANPSAFREALLTFNEKEGIQPLISTLQKPTARASLFPNLEDREFADLLLRLGGRNTKGQFIGAADQVTVGELRATRKALNEIISQTDDVKIKSEAKQLIAALDDDVQSSLASSNKEITINGQVFNPRQALNEADNIWNESGNQWRSQVVQDIRTGRITPSNLYDYVTSTTTRGEAYNPLFEEIMGILDKGDLDFIPTFRAAFGERLKDAIGDASGPNRRKIALDFFRNNSGIARRLYDKKELRTYRNNVAGFLKKVDEENIKYNDALNQIKNRFSFLQTGDPDDVMIAVDKVIRKPENLPITGSDKKFIINLLNENPGLKVQFKNYLGKDFINKITVNDEFYGTVIDGDRFLEFVKRPDFKQVYGEIFGTDYVQGINAIAQNLKLQQRALGREFNLSKGKADRGTANKIAGYFGEVNSEGQQIAQFLLGPLNKYSVKFRIADKRAVERGFNTVAKLLTDEELLEEFIKNRTKKIKDVRKTQVLSSFLSRQLYGTDSELPEKDIQLIP